MYADFITSHGGIAPTQFKEALDIFSQFFICPLFTESATERELNAVDHENEKNIQNDAWRLHQLEHSLSKPGHDFHKFGTGNKQTLWTTPREKGIDTREELLKFHSKYYSANVMGLAILCKEPLDEMTRYVCELFGNTVNKKVKAPMWPEHPYGIDQLKRRVLLSQLRIQGNWNCCGHVTICTNGGSQGVKLLGVICLNNFMPDHYLGHLLGHEGPGSLLSALKARSWVNSICAGGKGGATGFSFMSLSVDLTESGLDHVDDVVTMAYQYIAMLRAAGPQEWIVEEGRDLNIMNFKFKDNEKPRALVTGLAGSLHYYPLEEVVSGPYLWKNYEPKIIQDLMEKLVPENMLRSLARPNNNHFGQPAFASKANRKEKWYGVAYAIEPHDPELEAKWAEPELHESLKLPGPNAFIPHNYEIPRDPDHSNLPRIIKNTALSRCWFKQDDEFNLPKGCITVAIRSSLSSNSPLNANLAWLYLRLFSDVFAEYSYDAALTRLNHDLNTTHYGIMLVVTGYTDKLGVLLETIMKTLTTFKPDESRVAVFREQYTRGLNNFKMAQPTTHADYRLGLLLKEGGWTTDELLECIDEMTLENLTAFIPQFLARIHMESLLFGNFTVDTALSLISVVEDTLVTNMKSKALPHSQQTRVRREVQLPDDCSYKFNCNNDIHSSSCIYNFYQLGLEDTHSTMLVELLHQIIKDPCFNTLRTQEQLGYIVGCYVRRGSGVHGLLFIIQSMKHPDYVDHRIETFLSTVKERLENLTDTDYQKHISGLVAARLAKPKKMKARHNRYWNEIATENYVFNREDIETAHVKTITQQQLVGFFKSNIAAKSSRRHKLSVRILSKSHRDGFIPQDDELDKYKADDKIQTAQTIEDHIDFKRSMQLFPLPKSAIHIPKITMSKL
ncbi:IDE [Bugula neritina]|uniref:IDE n=1 Tax=Bugula neritina TaxID=10212 RepID=A0A7J7JI67_BUGNE|nr:IDE [Bugula neritina]